LPSKYQILLNGTPADSGFYDRVSSLEVEENADMPGSLQLRLPISRTEDGELSGVNESGLQPFANIAVVVTPEKGSPGCIFDGYVLSHKVHIESAVRSSWLELYAQDASWLMNLEEKTREWANTTDATAASSIFSEYGITPGSDNSKEDSGVYSEDTHTLMQRGTDFDFLRGLARRSGRVFRVSCGPAAGARIGIFAKPNLDSQSVATFRPNDAEAPNVSKMDFEWDIMRPTAVKAAQALFTDTSEDGASGDADSSGLSALDERDLATFAGKSMTVVLTTPADDAGQLQARAQAVLRESQWFARATGEADIASLHKLLRAGDIATVETVGSVHSGKYLVWSVRHVIGQEAHKMNFQLVRNAMGAAPSSAGGLLGGLL
jgi:phage protein D